MKYAPIPEFVDYEINEIGTIRRISARRGGPTYPGKVLKWKITTKGYASVILYKNGKRHERLVHRLVLETFCGPAPTGNHEAAHNDGNPLNNSVKNLRWATPKENQNDRILHGTHLCGERHKSAKLTEKQVLEIRADRGNQRILAARYGVSLTLIEKIKAGKVWAHLNQGGAHG